MCDGQAVGRTVGRALCHARRAVSRAPLPYRRYRFGASPVPLVGPDGERRSVRCGSLLIAEPRCCRRRYSRRRRYCTELYCKARLGTPTSSPRRNFAALAAPGEGGAEGGGNGAPLSLPNSCDVCRAAAAAPPTSRDSVLGVDVRVGPERDVFLKHGL